MNPPNQWREITSPQKPPVPAMQIDGPNMSQLSVETSKSDPAHWWLYLSCSSGRHIPRVEGEPHPLGAALDYGISHCECMLTWLRERRAELGENHA